MFTRPTTEPTDNQAEVAVEATPTTTTTTEEVMNLNPNIINNGRQLRENIIKADERTQGGVIFLVGLIIALIVIVANGTMSDTYTIPLVGKFTQLELLVFSVVAMVNAWLLSLLVSLFSSKKGV